MSSYIYSNKNGVIRIGSVATINANDNIPIYPPLALNKITTAGYNSVKCAYGCKLLNANYKGPIMNLRYTTDTTGTSTKDFYSDADGNLYSAYNSTGITVSSWLSTAGANLTYAYVTKWYDQSITYTNHAFITTTANQPIYDVANKVVNFGYTVAGGGSVVAPQKGFLYVPDGTLPGGDSSFTIVTKVYNFDPTRVGTPLLYSCGNLANGFFLQILSTAMNVNVNYMSGTGSQMSTTTLSNSSTYTYKYTSFATSSGNNNSTFYINGTLNVTGGISTATNLNATPSSIGNNPSSYVAYSANTANYQLYYFYISGSALSDADRLILEAT